MEGNLCIILALIIKRVDKFCKTFSCEEHLAKCFKKLSDTLYFFISARRRNRSRRATRRFLTGQEQILNFIEFCACSRAGAACIFAFACFTLKTDQRGRKRGREIVSNTVFNHCQNTSALRPTRRPTWKVSNWLFRFRAGFAYPAWPGRLTSPYVISSRRHRRWDGGSYGFYLRSVFTSFFCL